MLIINICTQWDKYPAMQSNGPLPQVNTIGIDIEAMIIVHCGDKQNLQWLLGAPKTTLPLHTGEQLDLLMMRNSIMKNITKQIFCFVTIPYVTVLVKNEK